MYWQIQYSTIGFHVCQKRSENQPKNFCYWMVDMEVWSSFNGVSKTTTMIEGQEQWQSTLSVSVSWIKCLASLSAWSTSPGKIQCATSPASRQPSCITHNFINEHVTYCSSFYIGATVSKKNVVHPWSIPNPARKIRLFIF